MATSAYLEPNVQPPQPKRLGVILLIVLANVGMLLLLTASAAAGLKTGPQATGLYAGGASGSTATGVAAGASHTCAVAEGGGVKCWGANSSGQLGDGTTTDSPVPVWVKGLGAASGVTATAAGGSHTCAVVKGGVQCWGMNEFGQLGDETTTDNSTPVWVSGLGPDSGVTAVAAGVYHTCAVIGGGAQCWGRNDSGQLGDGTTTSSSKPVAVSGLGNGVMAIAAGEGHTCAVTGSGVKCWGANWSGQLGDGTTTDNPEPVGVIGLGSGVTVAAIAAGYQHTCAATGVGMKCWGSNVYGQLGDGTNTDSPEPVWASGLGSVVTAIAAGQGHTCAVVSGGAQCWGYDEFGQLGIGTTTELLIPSAVSGLGPGSGVTAIATGGGHTCAVVGGELKCWGLNDYGQLGNGATTRISAPAAVSGLSSGVTAIAAGYDFTCAVAGGGAQCWGDNESGQLGDGTTIDTYSPVTVSVQGGGGGVTALAAGDAHACAVVSGGAQCWGWNDFGQLGIGSTESVSVPVGVNGLGAGSGVTVTAMAAGGVHTCAVVSGGVQCWGHNGQGQLGITSTTSISVPVWVIDLPADSGVTAIATGAVHTCAVVSGGVKCWGYGGYGQLGNGATVGSSTPVGVKDLGSGATEIAAGDYHTCALVSGGVKCWGANAAGQLGINPTTSVSVPVGVSGLPAGSGVTAIAAGDNHSCAILSGGVMCWGSNDYGQLGDGTTTSSSAPKWASGLGAGSGVTAIAAGGMHTCAVLSGSVKCWGDIAAGQLGINPGWSPVDVRLTTPVYLPFIKR